MPFIQKYSSLELSQLLGLMKNDYFLLVVPNYCTSEFIKNFVSSVKDQKTENYLHEQEDNGIKSFHYFGVDRIGTSFNTTYNGNPKTIEQYYKGAMDGTRLIRKLGGGTLSPIDRLRLELDEIMPFGAQIGRFENQTMLAGITRITPSEKASLLGDEPHFDFLPEKYTRFEMQLAANIYLQTPAAGGELVIWPTEKDLPEDFIVPLDWGKKLAVEPIIYQPNPGDLVIFNVRRPHAVRAFSGTVDRISLQCFLGFNPGRPLNIWN